MIVGMQCNALSNLASAESASSARFAQSLRHERGGRPGAKTLELDEGLPTCRLVITFR
jgi:hypothetical protein